MTANDFELKTPADFVNHIYSVAIDPERMGELVDSWERQIGHPVPAAAAPSAGSAATSAAIAALDRVITAHAERLSELLGNFRTASFILSSHGLIVAVNDAANAVFAIMPGSRLQDLPLDEASLRELSASSLQLFENAPPADLVVRLRHRESRHTILLHLRLTDTPSSGRHVVAVSSEQPWSDDLTALLARQFSITGQEAQVLQALARGETVKDLADLSGRSAGTIRSQIHALLTKTGLKSQAELVRLAMTLLHSAGKPVPSEANQIPSSAALYTLTPFRLPDGRQIHFRSAGAKDGRPFLLLPSGQGFIRWTDRAEQEMARRGLRMLAVVRAGYGPSSPCPPDVSAYDIAADDMAAFAQHLGLGPCPAVAICDDIKIAHHLAQRHPGMLTHIIGAAATMPLQTPAQFSRLSKFVRFVQMNATYSPRTLPYVSLLFFHMARRLGTRRFLQTMMAGCPADVRALETPEIAAPMMASTEIVITPHFMAHAAWSREITEFAKPWAPLLLESKVPLTLLNGVDDPFSPIATVREYAAAKPSIRLIQLPDAGQTLVYTHHGLVLDEIERTLGA